MSVLLKAGDWNSMRIIVTGPHYTVFLNGTQILDWTSDSTTPSGPIGLQLHANKEMTVHFRNLKMTEKKG
jgi:hypothetical protein